MSIPTQMSPVGFVASAPELHFTKPGAECCRLRAGVEQWRKEGDGSFPKLDPTFHDMVAFEHGPPDARADRSLRGSRGRARGTCPWSTAVQIAMDGGSGTGVIGRSGAACRPRCTR
jgi:hypothetical protein